MLRLNSVCFSCHGHSRRTDEAVCYARDPDFILPCSDSGLAFECVFPDLLKSMHGNDLLPDKTLCAEVILECVKGRGKEEKMLHAVFRFFLL